MKKKKTYIIVLVLLTLFLAYLNSKIQKETFIVDDTEGIKYILFCGDKNGKKNMQHTIPSDGLLITDKKETFGQELLHKSEFYLFEKNKQNRIKEVYDIREIDRFKDEKRIAFRFQTGTKKDKCGSTIKFYRFVITKPDKDLIDRYFVKESESFEKAISDCICD